VNVGNGINKAPAEPRLQGAVCIKGAPQMHRILQFCTGFFCTGFHVSDRRQCSWSLLWDLGVTLLITVRGPLTSYLHHWAWIIPTIK